MTAKTGTPKSIPRNPNIPPAIRIENITQKVESPVDDPKIFGPIIFPSTCCNTIINISRYNACHGLCITTIRSDGIAPMNGPNTGITFVIPIITATSTVEGI